MSYQLFANLLFYKCIYKEYKNIKNIENKKVWLVCKSFHVLETLGITMLNRRQ